MHAPIWKLKKNQLHNYTALTKYTSLFFVNNYFIGRVGGGVTIRIAIPFNNPMYMECAKIRRLDLIIFQREFINCPGLPSFVSLLTG